MNKMSEELAIHDKDTGSSEFQIAELTSKILDWLGQKEVCFEYSNGKGLRADIQNNYSNVSIILN